MGSLPKTKKKNIPKSIHEMSKEALQETLKKKKECNAKALETVERLCESNVDEEWFLNNLQFINQCHFDDATIERAITKVCGYPLCDGKLEKVPAQQYHISTRYNKVFDITERKNFCSSSCYKSAIYVKKQLFTSPLWFRDQEVIPKYTILKSNKSSLGEEVVFLPDKIKLEDYIVDDKKRTNNSVENSGKLKNNCSDAQENINNLDKNINELVKKCTDLTIKETDETDDSKNTEVVEVVSTDNADKKTKLLDDTIVKEKNPIIHEKTLLNEASKNLTHQKSSESNKTKTDKKSEPVNVIQKIENCFFEWFSLDTLFYLYGEQKLKELFKDKATAIKEVINSKLSLAVQGEKINKMIQLYGLLDSDFSSGNGVKTNLKPLPDYSILKEEGKTLEIKVKAFYQGQLQIKETELVQEKKEETETTHDDHGGDHEPIYLPLIDAHAQTALRRKIVLDKLNKVLPELMKVINSEYSLQMNEVRNLISTFTLSAHNITFKPSEWSLVGIILLKLLSVKNKKLGSALSSESSKNQLLVILMSYQIQNDYLDQLLHRLTDSENLMQKLKDINR